MFEDSHDRWHADGSAEVAADIQFGQARTAEAEREKSVILLDKDFRGREVKHERVLRLEAAGPDR